MTVPDLPSSAIAVLHESNTTPPSRGFNLNPVKEGGQLTTPMVSCSIVLFATLYLIWNYYPRTFPLESIKQPKKKQLHWPLKWWVIHFLLAQLFSQKFLPLTCHLPPLLLAMNYKPHFHGPSLPQHLSNRMRMVLCWDWFVLVHDGIVLVSIMVDPKYSRHKFQNKNYIYRQCIT